jgi:hypothetical protein
MIDKSEVYIKMCAQANEIQKKCNHNYEDSFIRIYEESKCEILTKKLYNSFDKSHKDNIDKWMKDNPDLISFGHLYKWSTGKQIISDIIEYQHSIRWAEELGNDKLIWLPRQDQLQEIVTDMGTWIDKRPLNVLARFNEWMRFSDMTWINDNTTIEQMWLAFVMQEKYNKIWDGEKWQSNKGENKSKGILEPEELQEAERIVNDIVNSKKIEIEEKQETIAELKNKIGTLEKIIEAKNIQLDK